jgi:predicted neuraminidase
MRVRRLAGAALALCAAAGIGIAAQTPQAKAPQAQTRQAKTGTAADTRAPFLTAELIFPLEHWHNHSSAIVETPGGDLLVCWFHGSGERTADDVIVQGARLKKGSRQWSAPFLLADTPGYPDTNATLLLDPQQRLWMFWPTILANEWQTALMKYKRAPTADGDGAPKWDTFDVMHVTPGDEFKATTDRVTNEWLAKLPAAGAGAAPAAAPAGAQAAGSDAEPPRPTPQQRIARLQKDAGDKLTRRLGWMTRAHPVVLDGTRLIVPLYSDGFSFSLMAISDDWGRTWKTSTPLVGAGNIQPSIARRKDGTLVTYMRDNGPAPKRLMMSTSTDRGETWSPVVDSEFFNPGSGAEVLALRNGHWVLIYNDLERGRYSLAVSLSEDEGRTWTAIRHLERDTPASDKREEWGEYHYPSIVEAHDGTLHASYSYFAPAGTPVPASTTAGPSQRIKSIKHAHFNEAWIKQGDK